MLPIAIDAMGGDKAPGEIVAGALRAADELGYPMVLVGRPEEIGDAGGLEIVEATEVIAMDEDPAQGVRRKKDSSLVRAAELVRDGRASAMVSAGNTGAAMASALLRMGRLPKVARPAIATPIPNGDGFTILLDSGANAECKADWLVQFAQMGAAYSTARFGVAKPRVGLLSIGEESSKGNPLVKEAHSLLAGGLGAGISSEFIGNVEGRDIMAGTVDVVVTDGFTGNVTLKALEGAVKFLIGEIFSAFGSSEEAKAASSALMPALSQLVQRLDPELTGGAMLLGVNGVCIISHGSSSATAIVSAARVAGEMVERDLLAATAVAVAGDNPPAG